MKRASLAVAALLAFAGLASAQKAPLRYQRVQSGGSDLPREQTLNFFGAITCDGGSGVTSCGSTAASVPGNQVVGNPIHVTADGGNGGTASECPSGYRNAGGFCIGPRGPNGRGVEVLKTDGGEVVTFEPTSDDGGVTFVAPNPRNCVGRQCSPFTFATTNDGGPLDSGFVATWVDGQGNPQVDIGTGNGSGCFMRPGQTTCTPSLREDPSGVVAGSPTPISGRAIAKAESTSCGTTSVGTVTTRAGEVLFLSSRHSNSVGAITPATAGTLAVTWVAIANVQPTGGGDGNNVRLMLWRAYSATAQTGTVGVNLSGGASPCYIGVQLVGFTGVDTSGTHGSGAVVQTVTSTVAVYATAASKTVTLAAFDNASNTTYAVFGVGATVTTPTAGAGFSLLQTSGTTLFGAPALWDEYQQGADTTADVSMSPSADVMGIAVELKSAVQGSGPAASSMQVGGTYKMAQIPIGSMSTGMPFIGADSLSQRLVASPDGGTAREYLVTTPDTAVNGGLLFSDGTTAQISASGSEGQVAVLRSNVPTWETVATGVSSFGAVGSGNANGGSVSGSVATLHVGTATQPGIVAVAGQYMPRGEKVFQSTNNSSAGLTAKGSSGQGNISILRVTDSNDTEMFGYRFADTLLYGEYGDTLNADGTNGAVQRLGWPAARKFDMVLHYTSTGSGVRFEDISGAVWAKVRPIAADGYFTVDSSSGTGGNLHLTVESSADSVRLDNAGTEILRAESTGLRYKGTDTITAFAGGGQGSATALGSEVNFVTTVATAADSVKLWTPSAIGVRAVVWNLDAADALAVFPASGGTINALGVDTAYSLAAGAALECWSQTTTQWWCK